MSFLFLFQVLEVIGRENIKLNEKQIDEIVELLKKEEEQILDLNSDKTIDSTIQQLKADVKLLTSNKQDNSKDNKQGRISVDSEKKEPTSIKPTTNSKAGNSNKFSFPITPSMEEAPKPSAPSASSQDIRKSTSAKETKSNDSGEPTKKC